MAAARPAAWIVAICVAGAAMSPWVFAQSSPPAQGRETLDLVNQARRLNAEGKQDEALALYRDALQKAPDSFDAHYGAAVALDLKGSYKEAHDHLVKAIELAPEGDKDQALTALAISYAFEGNTKQAATFYRQVFDRQMSAQNFNGAAETANALGRVYLETGDLDNALKWYQTGYETARRQPNLPGPQLDLWSLRWAHAQARLAARRGKASEARRQLALVKALVDKGTNPDQAIQYPYLAGYVDFYLKDYRAAIAELQHADQTDPFILVLLAQAYERAEDGAKAREFYGKVLQSNSHGVNNALARPLAKRKIARSG